MQLPRIDIVQLAAIAVVVNGGVRVYEAYKAHKTN